MPKKKFVRKKKAIYPMVSFTLPDVFGDAEFVLPETGAMPIGAQRAAMAGNVNPMFQTFKDAGVDDETIAALDELTGTEIDAFLTAWNNASPVSAGKSSS